MSLSSVIKNAIDSVNTGASGVQTNLKDFADAVSLAVATYIIDNSSSVSSYSGGSVATASGTGSYTELEPDIMAAPFYTGMINTWGDPSTMSNAFAIGLVAMLDSGTVEEDASGTSTGGSPISFTGVGKTSGSPADGAPAYTKMKDMESMLELENLNLQVMADGLAAVVYTAFPRSTVMTQIAPGSGTMDLA